MRRVGRLHNPIQRYAWGCRTSIPALLGRPSPSEEPHAEMWMGAHPKAPSKIELHGTHICLLEAIQRDPIALLGEEVALRFDGQLPFLFKLLAADQPLSIQAHPNLEQARRGFLREEQAKIPRDAPHRNYRDPFHKPEVICALGPFYALRGFRAIGEILELFDFLGLPTHPHRFLEKQPSEEGLRLFFASLLQTPASDKRAILRQTAQRLDLLAVPEADPKALWDTLAPRDRALVWVRSLASAYPDDLGILAPLFLNLLRLEEGQAMYLPAGELHAYLGGFGVELMANSDNVLRGGLTPKHLDLPELLDTLHFRSGPVEILHPHPEDPISSLYKTPAQEFALARLSLRPGLRWLCRMPRSAEILFCLEGQASVLEDTGDTVLLQKGESVFLPASVGGYALEGTATLFRAFVPA